MREELLLLFVLGVAVGVVLGALAMNVDFKREAVLAGHAEYITKDGRPEWRWRP